MSHSPRLQAIFDARQAVEAAWSNYVAAHRETYGFTRGAKAARTVTRRAFDLALDAVKDLAIDELRAIERRGHEVDWQGLKPRHTPPVIAAPAWSSMVKPQAEDQCE